MKKSIFLFLFLFPFCFSFAWREQQITPECVLITDGDRYIIEFELPNYSIESESADDEAFEGYDETCDDFYEIRLGNPWDEDTIDHDVTDVIGFPELPFFSLNLLVPDGFQPNMVDFIPSIEEEYINGYIKPTMGNEYIGEEENYYYWNGNRESEPCWNEAYYNGECAYTYYQTPYEERCGFYDGFYTISDVFDIEGYKGITLSIFPFSYSPSDRLIRVLRHGSFQLYGIDEGYLEGQMEELTNPKNVRELSASMIFDNMNDVGIYPSFMTNVDNGPLIANTVKSSDWSCKNIPNTGKLGTYRIIVARRNLMSDALCTFVQYKQSLNYEVDVICLEEYGLGNPNIIRMFTEGADFVLLIGSLEDIPPSDGSEETMHPYTDKRYNAFSIGRWIVSDTQELEEIITKTMEAEKSFVNMPNTAVLFSGVDKKKRRSRQFYKNIKKTARKSFGKLDMHYDLYDGRHNNANDMSRAMSEQPHFFIYRGHGGYSAWHDWYDVCWIDKPYNVGSDGSDMIKDIKPTSIQLFHNSDQYALGFGLACHLNSYQTDNNFGASWIKHRNSGGVTFYGASTTSYTSSNNRFSIILFKTLKKLTKKINNFPIGFWLTVAEHTYFNGLPFGWRRAEAENYNLIGDPTLAVYGIDYDGQNFAPFHKIKQKDYSQSFEQDNTNPIVRVEIYDIQGRRVLTGTDLNDIDTKLKHNGVYIVKIVYEDGTISTNKLIK